MAFTTTKFDDASQYKIAFNGQVTNSVTQNLTNGPGVLYSVKIENTNDADVYLKIANAYTATPGTTAPTWIFRCTAAVTSTFEIPGGVAYDALSCWATENAAQSDNTTPSVSGNEAIRVTIVTG
jgi:hypothetical protein